LRILGAVITLPLLFFIPGYVFLRTRLFSSKDMHWIEKILLAVVLSVSAASLIALFLAEVGYLRVWLVDLLLAALTLAARLIFGDQNTPIFSPRPVRWEIVVVVVLVLLSLVMFFRPAEFVAGEGDPEYYFNNGYHLAHTGSMSVYDRSVPKMSEFEIGSFYYTGIAQFFPFHLRNRATGRIQPLLYHLLPTWIAIFIMLFGTWGGLYVVPLFALLGMLALFALARRFSGLLGAAIATLLGTLFFLQVWFSRAPTSEVFCQLFVLAAILFFYEFLASKDVLVGLATAASVTAASTARPEALLMVIPMLAVMATRMFTDRYRAGDYVFVNAMLAGQVYVLLYVWLCERQYVSSNFGRIIKLFGRESNMNTFLIVWALLIGASFVFFNLPAINRFLTEVGGRVSERTKRYRQYIARSGKAALALATLATLIYSYFVSAKTNSSYRFLFNTAFFFGGVAVFVFVAGLCLLIYEMDSFGTSFLVASFVIVNTISVQESSLALGRFPWDSRRFMLVVVPMLAVGFGYLANRLWETRRVELRTLAIAASACFLILFCYYLAPIFNLTEYKGVDRQLTAYAKKMDKDVVIFTGGYLGETVGLPLRYQHSVDARKIFTLSDPVRFAELVEKYNREGKKVLLEASGIGANEIPYNPAVRDLLNFKKAFKMQITYPRLFPVSSGRPSKTGIDKHETEFYYLEPKAGSP
jgi:hypothetical protein